jgi:threonine/homoserine/homoserine lactone efflux protein
MEKSRPLSFNQAALFQWVNPKVWVMAVSAIAAFTTAGSELYAQTLIIALVVMLVGFPCVGV